MTTQLPDCEARDCFEEGLNFVEVNGELIYFCEDHLEMLDGLTYIGKPIEVAVSNLVD